MTNPMFDNVKKWFWSIAFKKAAYSVARVVVAFVTSKGIQPILVKYGVTVDPVTLQASLIAGTAGSLAFLQNLAKNRFKWNFL